MRTLIAAIFASTVALASWQAAEAAETGNFLYGQRLYSVGDFTGALNEWQPLAQQGDARAQTSLAILYLKGRGVPQNKTKAEEWAGRAAAQGYKPGQRLLQQLNKRRAQASAAPKSKQLKKKRAQAHAAPKSKQRTPLSKMPVVAGNFEDGEAAYTAGDHQKAFRLWKPLADQGDAKAQYYLGGMYGTGLGVPKDGAKHIYWLTKAAKQGYVDAQSSLGFMYANDWVKGVVPEDAAKAAFYWFTKAAKQGAEDAQSNLGVMYARGEGVPKDDVRAYAWLSISLKRSQFDNHHIKQFKETVVKRMTPTQIAEAQKLSRELWGKYVVPFQKK
ncbi:MAG: hypothetical protein QGG19_16325 [Alphaproteobacteria bacterium]|jgi:hypothetical protein|nr:hypothetical protein [Alphaproteobacteria bacterium]MDP7458601.1 hypothetical protein [Alphaproteobacteria bacterium]|tara:strand:+ start:887 stop:1876 length:990 start_codon:yes stop_codon:yes gene_type:complete